MTTVNKIIEDLGANESVNEGVIEEGWGDNGRFIGRTQYFDAYDCGDEVKLSDLNGNYTMLQPEEIQDFIKLLQKCLREVKK